MNAATFSFPSTSSKTLAQQIQEKLQDLEVDSVEELREGMQEKHADIRFDELQKKIESYQQAPEATVVASPTTPAAINAEALTQKAQEQLRELEVDSIKELHEEIQEEQVNTEKSANKARKRLEGEERFNELQAVNGCVLSLSPTEGTTKDQKV